jgi:hypothetical protein
MALHKRFWWVSNPLVCAALKACQPSAPELWWWLVRWVCHHCCSNDLNRYKLHHSLLHSHLHGDHLFLHKVIYQIKLLGNFFQECTTRQTSDNHFSEYMTLLVENKGKFKGIKNQMFHNVSLVLELQTITRNFIRTRSVTIVGRKIL